MCGCSSYGAGIMAAVAGAEAAANAADTDPLLRGMFSLGMCIARNQMTAFDAAVEWAGRVRSALGRTSPYLAHVDFQAGSVAMAQGRTQEARNCYDRALTVARASHLRDASAVMIGEALAAELEFERSAVAPRVHGPWMSPRLLGECSAWLDVYAASIGGRSGPCGAAGRRRRSRWSTTRGSTPAAPSGRRWRGSCRRCGSRCSPPTTSTKRSARGASTACPSGRPSASTFRPGAGREVEMLACARLRLFIAQGAFDAGREFAAALQAVAAERVLVRTRMRGLALSVVLEH